MDKPLQRIDHIMWDAETPNSPVTIAGIMTFKRNIKKEKIVEIIRKGILKYDRFHKKVIIKGKNPIWHTDEDFQLQTHIHHIALPGKGDHKELQECISDLVSQPFNYNKPLWDVHLIDNYQGGSVLLWRLHHAIADGMALVKVIFSLTGNTAKESLSLSADGQSTKKSVDTGILNDEIEHVLDLLRNFYKESKNLLSHPKLVGETIQHSWQTLTEIGEIFLGKTVTNTIYKGRLGSSKKAAWSEPLPLETIKQISKYHGTTINDILLVAVAGALRKHLLLHNQTITEGIRIVVPVNMRKDGEINSLHNEFGWISLELPVHMSKFKDRLAFIKEKTVLLKPSVEPLFLNELLHVVADYTPYGMKQWFLEFMGARIAGVITNVPGPRQPVYLAGEKVEDLMFWVPHTTALGIGISLMSYDGKVYMGIVTDAQLVSDPEVISHGFMKEIDVMKKVLQKKRSVIHQSI